MNAVANVNKRSKSTDLAKKRKTKDNSEPNSQQGVSGQGKEAKKNNNQEGGVKKTRELDPRLIVKGQPVQNRIEVDLK